MGSAIIWLTGLPAAGKSTTAQALRDLLEQQDRRVAILDGDDLRKGLNSDLGFSDADRTENVRRTAEVARIVSGLGIVAIVSLISPLQAQRAQARSIAGRTRFLEVFIDAPLSVCVRRDPKGLYQQARDGAIRNLTGFDSVYEAPLAPDVHLHADEMTPHEAAARILGAYLTAA